jgi:hypothetical protein
MAFGVVSVSDMKEAWEYLQEHFVSWLIRLAALLSRYQFVELLCPTQRHMSTVA